MHNFMLWMGLSDIWQCEVIAFVSFLSLYFVFILYTNFTPLWNQYTDFIVSSCLCACRVSLICQVWSALCLGYSELYSLGAVLRLICLNSLSMLGWLYQGRQFCRQTRLDRGTRGIHDSTLQEEYRALPCRGNHDVIRLKNSRFGRDL